MNKIKVMLAGVERGPFTEDTIRLYLAQGILLPTEMARFDKETEWQPVAQVLTRIAPPSAPESHRRKKRKTSQARHQSRQRRLAVFAVYLLVVGGIAACFLYKDDIWDFIYNLNYNLYQEVSTWAI